MLAVLRLFTQWLKKRMSPCVWRVTKWLLLLAAGLLLIDFGLKIWRCEIAFSTTISTYMLLWLAAEYACEKSSIATNIRVAILSVIFSLFLSEIVLRYWLKYPETYTEANGGDYQSEYCTQQVINTFWRPSKEEPTLWLNKFEPYAMRNSADAETTIRPLEMFNALGTRGPLPKKNKKVVACLGDSFTESVCVAIDSSYPYLLEKQLQKCNPDVEVLNAGISGNDPFYDFVMLQYLKKRFNISAAVFLINTTDINEVMYRGGMERFKANATLQFVPRPWWERLYGLSYVVRIIAHNAFKLDFNFHTDQERLLLEQKAISELYSLFLQQVIPYCNKNNIQLILAFHPIEDELSNPSNYTRLVNPLKKLNQVHTVDAFGAIKKQNAITPLYYPVDRHFYGKGYQIIANTIADSIFISSVINNTL